MTPEEEYQATLGRDLRLYQQALQKERRKQKIYLLLLLLSALFLLLVT